MKKYILSIVLAILVLNPIDLFAQPQEDNSLSKGKKKEERKRINKEALKGRRFTINTNLTYSFLDSYLELTTKNGLLGVKLSLEKQFGFEKQKFLPSFDIEYAITLHSSIYAEYYSLNRSSFIDLREEFEYGELLIPEGAGQARLFLNTNIWSMGYMYSFINTKEANLSFFFNIFVLSVATGLDVDSQNVSKRLTFTAPLPSFGFKFNYEIAKRLRFGGDYSFFFLDIGEFGGEISNLRITMDYRVMKWLSLGLSYTAFSLDITSTADSFNGHISYNYSGPGLFFQFVF